MRKKLTAVILCGGKGLRLRPITNELPKPLVEINAKPILDYIIHHLNRYGIIDIIITTGYKSQAIEKFFEKNHNKLNIKIIDSGDSDIIERIKTCETYIDGDFMLLYGDTLADVNLEELQIYHKNHDKSATVTIIPFRSAFGLLGIDSRGDIISYREKPTLEEYVNIGFFCFNKEVFSWMREFNTFVDFLEFLSKDNRSKGFVHRGNHLTVNTLGELKDACSEISKFNFD
jgi:glucose-1-phosphate cytidylyltransferase